MTIRSVTSEFWRAFSPYLYRPEVMDRSVTEVAQITSLVSLPPNSAVLDLASGPFRHSKEFAKQGHRVTAVDAEVNLLSKNIDDSSIEFVCADMRSFVRKDAYDLAIILHYSFGIFPDRQDDLLLLRNIHQSLKPGGFLVIELPNADSITRWFQYKEWILGDDSEVVLITREIVDEGSWMNETCKIIKAGKQEDYEFGYRLYYGNQIEDPLAKAGYCSVQLFGGFDGTPPLEAGGHVVVRCQKRLNERVMVRC